MIRTLHNLITQVVDGLGAMWVLTTLAFRSGFNFRSSYWTWRIGTAFPGGKAPLGRFGMLRLTLEYARWASRIRRLR